MWDYFEQPQRAAEGRRQVPGTGLSSVQENPLLSHNVCALLCFTALCDLNRELKNVVRYIAR